MSDEDFGDEREPLLVRPFLTQDEQSAEPEQAGTTWPSGASADSPTQMLPVFPDSPTQALPVVPETPTQVLPVLSGTPTRAQPVASGTPTLVHPVTAGTAARSAEQAEPTGPERRRRPLLMAGAGAAVITVLAVTGYAALRPAYAPTWADDYPNHGLPAVTGPSPDASDPLGEAVTGGPDTGTAGNYGGGWIGGGSSTTVPTSSVSSSPAAAGDASAGPTASATSNAPAEASPSTVAPVTGPLVNGEGLCLDLPGGFTFDDNVIQVFGCNGSSAQDWTLQEDGTLRVLGKCVMLVGDRTVHLVGCDGRTTAQWQLTDDRELVNAANSDCLTDPSSGKRPMARVVVNDCNGRTNQRWTLG
ncbi:ricin-type beta-trefoil lectin domain protein [Actinoplanes sp. NPDC051851]|uniref:ricin-type beta-trefoil lectin domain protein n=1 Tax=Actinoplanes sp. NPDC051851 TaxID=3154753 RepID=UPI003417378D